MDDANKELDESRGLMPLNAKAVKRTNEVYSYDFRCPRTPAMANDFMGDA